MSSWRLKKGSEQTYHIRRLKDNVQILTGKYGKMILISRPYDQMNNGFSIPLAVNVEIPAVITKVTAAVFERYYGTTSTGERLIRVIKLS